MSSVMRWSVVLFVASVVFVACGAPIGVGGNFIGGTDPTGAYADGGTDGTGGGSGTGGSTGTGGGGISGFTGLPCDVAMVFSKYCFSCHYANNPSGYPSLVTRTDLLTISPTGESYVVRALTRMNAGTMPTSGGPVPAADIATVQSWVNAGAPDTTCNQAIDAGTPVITPVCTSGTNGTTAGSNNMNPGKPCKACHAIQEPGRNYGFMGTAYPTLHEKDQCNGAVPAGATVTVDILDQNGTFAFSMPVYTRSGNFYSGGRWATTPSPYRARVMKNGVKVAEMTTPQTNGDCNVCHTVLGTQGAPGRITF